MKNILSDPKPIHIPVGHQAIVDTVSDKTYTLELFEMCHISILWRWKTTKMYIRSRVRTMPYSTADVHGNRVGLLIASFVSTEDVISSPMGFPQSTATKTSRLQNRMVLVVLRRLRMLPVMLHTSSQLSSP